MTHVRLCYRKGSFAQEEFFLSRTAAIGCATLLMTDRACYGFLICDAEGRTLMGPEELMLHCRYGAGAAIIARKLFDDSMRVDLPSREAPRARNASLLSFIDE